MREMEKKQKTKQNKKNKLWEIMNKGFGLSLYPYSKVRELSIR